MSKVIVTIRCDDDQDRALAIAHIRSLYADKVVEIIRVRDDVSVSKMVSVLERTASHIEKTHVDLGNRMVRAGYQNIVLDSEQAAAYSEETKLQKDAADLASGIDRQE